MKALKIIASVLALGFIAFMSLGAYLSMTGKPSDPDRAAKQEACTNWWQDARPGPDKAMVRRICDEWGVKP